MVFLAPPVLVMPSSYHRTTSPAKRKVACAAVFHSFFNLFYSLFASEVLLFTLIFVFVASNCALFFFFFLGLSFHSFSGVLLSSFFFFTQCWGTVRRCLCDAPLLLLLSSPEECGWTVQAQLRRKVVCFILRVNPFFFFLVWHVWYILLLKVSYCYFIFFFFVLLPAFIEQVYRHVKLHSSMLTFFICALFICGHLCFLPSSLFTIFFFSPFAYILIFFFSFLFFSRTWGPPVDRLNFWNLSSLLIVVTNPPTSKLLCSSCSVGCFSLALNCLFFFLRLCTDYFSLFFFVVPPLFFFFFNTIDLYINTYLYM